MRIGTLCWLYDMMVQWTIDLYMIRMGDSHLDLPSIIVSYFVNLNLVVCQQYYIIEYSFYIIEYSFPIHDVVVVACMHFSSMHALQQPVCIVVSCMHCSSMYTQQQHICIVVSSYSLIFQQQKNGEKNGENFLPTLRVMVELLCLQLHESGQYLFLSIMLLQYIIITFVFSHCLSPVQKGRSFFFLY